MTGATSGGYEIEVRSVTEKESLRLVYEAWGERDHATMRFWQIVGALDLVKRDDDCPYCGLKNHHTENCPNR